MTMPNFSFPQADAIIEQLTTRIHDLIGTDYRDAAIDAASRAEAAADRLGSAETVEGWVASAEASAETASGAAATATSAVRAEVDKLTAGAPEAFDTLKEISDELEKNETERAALATTIGNKADKDHVDDEIKRVESEIASKGEQAVTNGNGLLGNKYWNTGTTVSLHTDDAPPGTFASFSTPERQAAIFNEVAVVIDPTIPTYVSGLFRQAGTSTVSTAYLALAPEDEDGNVIQAVNVMYLAGTTTEITEDLHPGDTVVKLASAENWENDGATFERRFIFWNYKSGSGKEWGPGTYSRNHTGSNTWSPGSVDYAANTITLREPWSGETVPAGTSVSNASNGGNYIYPAGMFIPGKEWTRFDGIMQPGVNTSGSGMSATRGWPPGTTAVRIGVLLNYRQIEESDIRFSSIHLSQVASAGHDHLSDDISDAVFRVGEADSYGKVFKASNTGRLYYTKKTQYSDEVANKEYVDQELSGKATKSEVDESLGKKADTNYVDSAVSDKATKSEVGKKADTTYVDQELGKKADSEMVNKRPALFHGYGPPGAIEGAVPGDKYMDLDEMEIYVLPEENA